MLVNELPTPALVVDRAALEHNLSTMAAALPGPRCRPHVKAHKCTELARRQQAAGHDGFTCATPREVAGMAAAGLGTDLLLANEVVDPERLARLATLDAARHRRGRLRGDHRRRRPRGLARMPRRRERRPPPLRVRAGGRRCAGRLRAPGRTRGARRHGLRRSRRRAHRSRRARTPDGREHGAPRRGPCRRGWRRRLGRRYRHLRHQHVGHRDPGRLVRADGQRVRASSTCPSGTPSGPSRPSSP